MGTSQEQIPEMQYRMAQLRTEVDRMRVVLGEIERIIEDERARFDQENEPDLYDQRD